MTSARHQITVERSRYSMRDNDQLETDALNGVGSIPGVSDVEIESSNHLSVTLSFSWTGQGQFDRTDEHLEKYGLQRRWPSK
jgi:hypothetical protein